MDKKFAIFDMDGTLIDSMVYWKNLASEYLKSKGVENISKDIFKKIEPMTMTESADLFIEEFSLKETVETIVKEMNEMMDEHYRKDIMLKKGVKEYLEKLSKKNIKMCVASATDEILMEICLSRLDIRKYFEFLLSCETVGVGKNKPDIYFKSVKRLGSKISETAVYEDAPYAIKTAREAGFYVIGIYDLSNDSQWDKIKKLSNKTICDFNEEE